MIQTCGQDLYVRPVRILFNKPCRYISFRLILAVRIFWGFDGTLQDLYNNFNGFGNNTPTYNSPGYNGAGSCIWLTRSSSQSVTIATPPFLNMAYTSFTLEAWMYAQSLCNGSTCSDNALFGQFQNNTLDQSLHIIVRNRRIYLGFFADDVQGNQVSEQRRSRIITVY